jgi:hypothetical protein
MPVLGFFRSGGLRSGFDGDHGVKRDALPFLLLDRSVFYIAL